MIDYHCHLLPSVDDGPKSHEDSLLMASALQAFGFREVYCTPHCIRGLYDLSPAMVREQVRSLQDRLNLAGIALRLHAGLEYHLDECFPYFAEDLLPLGNTRMVLCEAPAQAEPQQLVEMLELIIRQGFVPLLAHPERNASLYAWLEAHRDTGGGKDPDCHDSVVTSLLARVKRSLSPSGVMDANFPSPVLYQADLGSFVGFYGTKAKRQANRLFQKGIYACVASDLHDSESIPAVLHAGSVEVQTRFDLRRLMGFIPTAERID